MGASGIGLILSKIIAMGLGFVFWVAAARLFDTTTIGIAAASVSAVQLSAAVAGLGIGSAFISVLPKTEDSGALILSTSVSVVTATSFTAAVAFIAWFSFSESEVAQALITPAGTLLFVIMGIAAAMMVLFDHASMALRRGDQTAFRALVNGLLSLAPLAAAWAASLTVDGLGLFAFWVLGSLASVAVGVWQLRGPGVVRWFTAADRSTARQLIGLGLPNYLVTLFIRLPVLGLPILVSEFLTAETTAFWYSAWMTAWSSLVIPYSFSTALYAEGSHTPEKLRSNTVRMIKLSFSLGLPLVVLLAIFGPWVLSILGPGYQAGGQVTLRILLAGFVSVVLVYAHVAVCRTTHRFMEAALMTGISAGLILGLATYLAPQTGIEGVAWSFTIVMSITAVVAGFRLRILTGSTQT